MAEIGREIPGPTGMEGLRWMWRLRQDTFRGFVELSKAYGDVVSLPLMPGRTLILGATPEFAQHILQDEHRRYKKAVTYEFLEPVVGKGLLTSHGDRWLRQRRLVAPAFHRHRIESYVTTIRRCCEEMVERWPRGDGGQEIDISGQMSSVTLSIAGLLLFNRDIGGESSWIGDDLVLLFRDVNRRIMSPLSLPREVPTPRNRRVNAALERLEGLVYEMIDERRGRAEEYDDLLSMFMLAEDEESGQLMSDEEIRDEVMTFILAGHDTTSNLLAWSFALLSRFPEVRRRLEREVRPLEGRVPTVEEVRGWTYMDQVIDEVLRLYPPAWTVEREPLEDDVVQGYQIPAGSIVSVGPYFVHHNERVWPNPEGFDPGRFEGGRAERERYAHFPFGGGPRMCVGADFAILEAKFVLGTVLGAGRLDLVNAHELEAEGTVTLYPRQGVNMRFIPHDL